MEADQYLNLRIENQRTGELNSPVRDSLFSINLKPPAFAE
jgi:hypothetical protein